MTYITFNFLMSAWLAFGVLVVLAAALTLSAMPLTRRGAAWDLITVVELVSGMYVGYLVFAGRAAVFHALVAAAPLITQLILAGIAVAYEATWKTPPTSIVTSLLISILIAANAELVIIYLMATSLLIAYTSITAMAIITGAGLALLARTNPRKLVEEAIAG